MNKEQFKKSISNLINYYTNAAINYSMDLAQAEASQDVIVMQMIQGQIGTLTKGFEYNLDGLLDKVFPEEEDEQVVSAEE